MQVNSPCVPGCWVCGVLAADSTTTHRRWLNGDKPKIQARNEKWNSRVWPVGSLWSIQAENWQNWDIRLTCPTLNITRIGKRGCWVRKTYCIQFKIPLFNQWTVLKSSHNMLKSKYSRCNLFLVPAVLYLPFLYKLLIKEISKKKNPTNKIQK